MAIYDPRLDNARRAAQQRQSNSVTDLKSILSATGGGGDTTALRQFQQNYPEMDGLGQAAQPEIDFGGGIKGFLKEGIYKFAQSTPGKTLFKGLETLDLGRRATISIFDTAFSGGNFKDWLDKTKDPTYGFGKTGLGKDPFGKDASGFGGFAQKIGNGFIGFFGDVVLDPLTYVTLGAGKIGISAAKGAGASAAALDVLSQQGTREAARIGGRSGRTLLARAVLAAGGDENRAAQIARYGRSILTQEEHAMLGLRQSGLYFAGKRLPMTTAVGKVDHMFAGTRLALGDGRAFIGSRTFARLGDAATPTEMKAALRAIARGEVPEGQFSHYLALSMTKPIKSKSHAAAATDFQQTTMQILGEAGERFARNLPKTAYRDLEAGNIATGGALEKVQTLFQTLWEKQNNAVKEIDVAAGDLRKVTNYVPHLRSGKAMRWLDTTRSNMADSVRETLASITDDASIWKHRLEEGDIWFGHKLAPEDLNIDALNRIAREKGNLDFDFFETDMQRILAHYGNQYAANGGAIGVRKFLKAEGVFTLQDSKLVLDEDALAASKKTVNDLFHGTTKAVADAKQTTDDLMKSLANLDKAAGANATDVLGSGFRLTDQGIPAIEKQLGTAEAAATKALAGVDAATRNVDTVAQSAVDAAAKTAAASSDVVSIVGRLNQLVQGLEATKMEWVRVFNGQTSLAIDALKNSIDDSVRAVANLTDLIVDRTARSADLQALGKQVGDELARQQRLVNHITLHGNEIQGNLDRIISGSLRHVKPEARGAAGDFGSAMRASNHVSKETLAGYIDGTSIVDTKSTLWADAKKRVLEEAEKAGRTLDSKAFRKEQERVFAALGGDVTQRVPLDQRQWWTRAQGTRPIAKSEVKAMTEREASRIAARALDTSVPLAKQRAALLWLGAQAQYRIDNGGAVPEWFGRIFDEGGVADRVAALDMFYNGMNTTTKRGIPLRRLVSLQSNLRDVNRAIREGIHTYGAAAYAAGRVQLDTSAGDTALDVIDKLRGSDEARWVFHEDGFLYRRLEELGFVGENAEPKTVDQLRGVLRDIRDSQFDKPMEIRYSLSGPAVPLADVGEETLKVRMSDLGLGAIDFDPQRFDLDSLDRLADAVLSGGRVEKKGWVRLGDSVVSTRMEPFENAARRAQANLDTVANRTDVTDAVLDREYDHYREVMNAWNRREELVAEIATYEEGVRTAKLSLQRIVSGGAQKRVMGPDGNETFRLWTQKEIEDLKQRLQVEIASIEEKAYGKRMTSVDPDTGEVTSWFEGGNTQAIQNIDNWYNNQYVLPARPGSVFDDMKNIERDIQSEFPSLYNTKLLKPMAEDRGAVKGAVRGRATSVMDEAERVSRADVAQSLSRALVSDEITRRFTEATDALLRNNMDPTPQLMVHVSQAVAAKHYEAVAARTVVLSEVDSLISNARRAVADLGDGATADQMREAIDGVLSRASADAQDALRPFLYDAQARSISLRLQSNESYKRALKADTEGGATYTKKLTIPLRDGSTFDSTEQRSIAAKLGRDRKDAKEWAKDALEKGNRGQRAVQRELKNAAKRIRTEGALGGSEREVTKWLDRMSAQATTMLSEHRKGSAWMRDLADPFSTPEFVSGVLRRENMTDSVVGAVMEAFRQRGHELDGLMHEEELLTARRAKAIGSVPLDIPIPGRIMTKEEQAARRAARNAPPSTPLLPPPAGAAPSSVLPPLPNRVLTEAEQKARAAATRVAARDKIGPNELERVNAVLRALEDPTITTWDQVADGMKGGVRQSRKGILGWVDSEPETKKALEELFDLRKKMFAVRNSFEYPMYKRSETVFDVLDTLASVRTRVNGEMNIPVYHSSADQARLILQENAASARSAQLWNNPTSKVQGFGSADAATQRIVVEFPMEETANAWETSLVARSKSGERSAQSNGGISLVADHSMVRDDRSYRVVTSGDGSPLTKKDADAALARLEKIKGYDGRLRAAAAKVNTAAASGDTAAEELASQQFFNLAKERSDAILEFKSRVGLQNLKSKAIDLTLEGERFTINRGDLDRLLLPDASGGVDYSVSPKRLFPMWKGDSVVPVFFLTDSQKETLSTLGDVGQKVLTAAGRHKDAEAVAGAAMQAMSRLRDQIARLPEGTPNAVRQRLGDEVIGHQRQIEQAVSVMRREGSSLQKLQPQIRAAWVEDGVQRSSGITGMVNRIVNAIEDSQFTVADLKKAFDMQGMETAVDDRVRGSVDEAMNQWRESINSRVMSADPNSPQFGSPQWFPSRRAGEEAMAELERLQSQYTNLTQSLMGKHVSSASALLAEHAARLDRVEKTFLELFGGSAQTVRARYNGVEILGADGTSERRLAYRPKDPRFLDDVITVGVQGQIKAKNAEMQALAESVAKIRVSPSLAPRTSKMVSRTAAAGGVEALDRGSGALLSVRKLPAKYAHLQWVTAEKDGSFLWDPMKRFHYLLETRPAKRAETYGVAEAAAQVADEMTRLRPVGYTDIIDFEKSTMEALSEVRRLTDDQRPIVIGRAVAEIERIGFLLGRQAEQNRSLALYAQLVEVSTKHAQELVPIAKVGAKFEDWIKAGMKAVDKARSNRDGLLAVELEANRALTAAKDALKGATATYDSATALADRLKGEVAQASQRAASDYALMEIQRDNLKTMVEAVNSIGLSDMVSRGAVSTIPESERAVVAQRLSMLSDAVKDTEALMDDSASRWTNEITAIEARHANDPSTMRGLDDKANRSADAARWRKLTELVSYHNKFKAQAVDAQLKWNAVMLADDEMTVAWNRLSDEAMSGAFVHEVAADMEKGFTALDRIHMPSHVARTEILNMVQNVRNVPQGPLKYWIKQYTNFFRAYALLAPGVAVRNMLSNTFMLMVAGTSAEAWQGGFGLYNGYRKAWKDGTLEKWFATLGDKEAVVRSTVEIMDSVGGGQTDNAFGVVAHNRLYNNKVVQKSRNMNSYVEHVGRFTLAYDSALKGMDLQGGYTRVSKYLFDYSDTSSLDEAMRQIVPFWFWMSRNLPLQWQSRWTNPKMYTMWNSAQRNFEDRDQADTPLWMRESGGFSLSGGLGFVSFNPADSADERINTLLTNPKRLLADVNPLFRVGPEVLGDRKYYNDLPFGTKPQNPIGLQLGSLLLTPVKDDNGQVSPRWNYFLKSLVPPAAQGERLFGASYDGKHGNSLLSFVGSPVRQISPEDREQERERAQRAVKKAAAARKKRELDAMKRKLEQAGN